MEKSLLKLRERVRDSYKEIVEIHCPYFDEKVRFNSKGFNHLRYRGNRKERHFKAQKQRYELFYLAPMLLARTTTLQEFEEKSGLSGAVRFFGFIGILEGWKVKVIVRQIGDGRKYFWSVIPNWKTRRSRDGKIEFQKYTGNPASD